MIQQIDFAAAKELLDHNPDCILADVRDEAEYISGHAVDAILLPLYEMTEASAREQIPDLATPVLVYCRTGRRSGEAARKLESYGYENIYDLGSLVGWPYGMEG